MVLVYESEFEANFMNVDNLESFVFSLFGHYSSLMRRFRNTSKLDHDLT